MGRSAEHWAPPPVEPLFPEEAPLPVVGLFAEGITSAVVLDTETTGFSNTDRIIELSAAWVDLRTGKIDREGSMLLNPETRIYNSHIHGIRDCDVRVKPTFAAVWPRFLAFVGAGPIIAHNAKFDVRMIRNELERTQLAAPASIPFYCSQALAKKALPKQPSYKLQELARVLELRVEGAHRGRVDVHTTAQLVVRCLATVGTDLREAVAQGGVL